MGVRYLNDGIVATINSYTELEIYRVYETDCLYLICCALGNTPSVRYYNLVHPEMGDDGDAIDRPCEDIVSERLERFGIKVVG